MNPIICDTNVFIRLFAGDTVVENELSKIGSTQILLPILLQWNCTLVWVTKAKCNR